ncbi:MAG: ATP-binding protein [Rhodospirillaceae bacterium]
MMPRILSSLTNRIFLAAVLLVVVATGVTAAFVSSRVTVQAERELQRRLVESGAVVERQGEALVGTLSLLARLIADLPKLKAAVATADPPTVQPLAVEYEGMLPDAGLVLVTDGRGRVLALAGPLAIDRGTAAALPSVRAALGGSPSSSFRPHPEGLLQVLSVPITVGDSPATIAGSLSVGFLLDGAVASDFKRLTGSDIAFGLDGHVRASTVARASWPAIDRAFQSGEASRVTSGGADYVLLSTPFLRRAGAGGTLAASADAGTPFIVVLRSRTEQLSFLGPIQTAIGVTAVMTVLLATVLSYAVARTVTRPLGAITRVMREVAATGDLTRKIPVQPGSWEDEDARLLASTFNALIDSIARFEREAAQRERLSSLGRLSSVVAHEIRNPLMIIKSAARTLRQSAVGAAVRDEALQDIDDEVVRLNRIVAEVLDYAKPIGFTWHDADPNEVCREAAQAVQAADGGVAIQIRLAPELPPMRTDPERLRTVLVNVLQNASQAVRGAGSSGAQPAGTGGPAVTLRTAPREDGGVTIIVHDDGPGIDPATASRLFEPFFTTRRGGTGLGLAIARNIVDGLGGTIAITRAAPSGTDVCITLPPEPPRAAGGRTS